MNSAQLALTDSGATRITLITEEGRSGYTFGAIAGQLTKDAVVGSSEMPIAVHHVAVDVKASDSLIGGIAGTNETSDLFASVEQLELNLNAASISAGGVAGTNKGTLQAGASTLDVKDITLGSSGQDNRIGGVFGENRASVDHALAEKVTITSSGPITGLALSRG